VFKSALAGFLLSFTMYKTQLFIEAANEGKATEIVSQAQIKVDHYKELEKLAEKDEKEELLKTFNETHRLNYNLALDVVSSGKDAQLQAVENMDIVESTANLILGLSVLAFLLSGLPLLFRSKECNPDVNEFTLTNSEVALVSGLLDKEINSIIKNPAISDNTVLDHKTLRDRLPE
jgi:hypothetical protein